MSGEIDRRQRAPWKPERGQYVSVLGIAVPEVVAFAVAMAVCVALLIVALVAF